MVKIDWSKVIDVITNKFTSQANEDIYEATRGELSKVKTEINNMYKSYITQYYNYKPKSYIRYGADIPSSGGVNLYFAMNCFISGGKFICEIDSSNIINHYQHNDPSVVMNTVINGERGVPDYWIDSWCGSYSGKYFNYSGTIVESLDYFFNNVQKKIGENVAKRLIKKWSAK